MDQIMHQKNSFISRPGRMASMVLSLLAGLGLSAVPPGPTPVPEPVVAEEGGNPGASEAALLKAGKGMAGLPARLFLDPPHDGVASQEPSPAMSGHSLSHSTLPFPGNSQAFTFNSLTQSLTSSSMSSAQPSAPATPCAGVPDASMGLLGTCVPPTVRADGLLQLAAFADPGDPDQPSDNPVMEATLGPARARRGEHDQELNLEEARILARNLGTGVEIYWADPDAELVRGGRIIERFGGIHRTGEKTGHKQMLLLQDGHYSVLREINVHPTIDPRYGLGAGPFALPGKGSDELRMFVKTPVRADASGAFQWIPADNNSFIRCLFHAANNRLPSLEEIASLRKAIWHGGGDANAPSVAEHEEDEAGSGDH